jgi:hypothetical protein
MVKENIKRNELTEAIIKNGQDTQRLEKLKIDTAARGMYHHIRTSHIKELQGQINANWARNGELINQYADNEESLAQ